MAPSAMLFLFLTCIMLPWISIKSARAVNAGAKVPEFKRQISAALFTQVFMLGFAIYTALNVGLKLFPPPHFEWRFAGVGLLTLAITLGTLPIRRRFASEVLKERMRKRMPHNGQQMAAWTLLSAMAGFGEEVVFRGVLFQILQYALHNWLADSALNWWAAALIASAVFALAHVIQGWFVATWIFAFSLGFHGLVWYCGDLYTAMIIHFLYDLAVGFIFGLSRFANVRSGLPPSKEQPDVGNRPSQSDA